MLLWLKLHQSPYPKGLKIFVTIRSKIMSNSTKSLLVVGSVAFDDLDGPFGPHKRLLGGSASYISTAASYFSPDVSLVAVVGDDFPKKHIDFFESKGINIDGLETKSGKTFSWAGVYSDDLTTRETLDTQLGVFADFQPKLNDAHKKADFLFLGNIHPSLQLSVLEQVGKCDLVAMDTMNFWIDGAKDDLLKTLPKIDMLIINDEEARQLAGVHNLVVASDKIRSMGPKSLVIKRGDAGAMLFDEDGVFFAPGLPLRQPKDPTGAGDCFAGGFMGYLAKAGNINRQTLRAAMIYGSTMASFAVEEFSLKGIEALTLGQIQSRFDAFMDLSQFERATLQG